MIELDRLPAKFIHFRERWAERNDRMDEIVRAVTGEYNVDDPTDDAITNRSPNFIQVALEDTAEAASLIPTVRVSPSSPDQDAKDSAIAMERMAMSYFDTSQIELLSIREIMDLAAYGVCAGLVYFDPESKSPIIQWRDPRTCFPEPGWKTLDSVRECFFARDVYVGQLEQDWQDKIAAVWPHEQSSVYHYTDRKVVLVEYFTEDEWLIAALYQTGHNRGLNGQVTYVPIELARGDNPGGICPVVVAQRPSLDGEPRGQFDQLIDMMKAHIRLMGLVLDYADQAVYSDVWVKDLIGPLNFGGGAYIQLGPNGSIGRVPPAVPGFSVFQELQALTDSMHLGGRYPKVRPGEVDQAIASAKFVEATAGVMNTAIRTYHLVMKRFWEQCLRLCFVADKELGSKRTVSGVLRNQQFLSERDPSEIDLAAKVRVEYGLGLGHDPASAMVLGIQMKSAGFVSAEFVQENFEGIMDVALERSRIDVERLRDMAFARLLMGLEQQTVPESALIEIARARAEGDDIFELFEKYIVKPAEEREAQALTSGLDGGQGMPGDPLGGPGGPGAPPPDAPPPDALLGALGIGGGPPGEEGPQAASRLNVPLGNGSFASSNAGF